MTNAQSEYSQLENNMKAPSAKIPQAKSKVPTVKTSLPMKAAHSGKVTVEKKSAKANGQKVTKMPK